MPRKAALLRAPIGRQPCIAARGDSNPHSQPVRGGCRGPPSITGQNQGSFRTVLGQFGAVLREKRPVWDRFWTKNDRFAQEKSRGKHYERGDHLVKWKLHLVKWKLHLVKWKFHLVK